MRNNALENGYKLNEYLVYNLKKQEIYPNQKKKYLLCKMIILNHLIGIYETEYNAKVIKTKMAQIIIDILQLIFSLPKCSILLFEKNSVLFNVFEYGYLYKGIPFLYISL